MAGDLTQLEPLRAYLLAKTGATEERPFGPDALVFKVMGKMFALVAWQAQPLTISLKCRPHVAEMLRMTYPAVRPGYHMNKKHWNTVDINGELSDRLIYELIDQVKYVKKENRKRKILYRL